MAKRTGKKKIDIKKIANNSTRNVTFSKRRTGLFKKAQELERISGARVAILVFSPSGRLYTSGDVSLFDNNELLKNSKTHLSTEIASNPYAQPSTLRLKNFNVEGSTEFFSPAGQFYSPDEVSLVDDFLKNNGFTSNSHLSTEIASNSYPEPSTLLLKNFNAEGSNEIFSLAGPFYSTGEFSIVDDLENNGFTSKFHLSTETASNSYSEPNTLCLKNFNFEGSAEIFSSAGQFYSSGEFPMVNDDLNNNGFTSKSHLSTETASNSYSEPSTLRLKSFNAECSTDFFSPSGQFYSSGELPIVDEDLKNHGFCSKSDLCTDFGSNLYGDWSTLWLENLNVEECSSVDELMLLKKKLAEERDKLVLKMELEFIESSLMV